MMRNTETLIYGLILYYKQKRIENTVADICSNVKVTPKEVYRNLNKLLRNKDIKKDVKNYIREKYYK